MFNFKNNAIRAIAIMLVLATLLCGVCACSPNKTEEVDTPILECGDSAIPLSFYELLLSRMKGTLAASQNDVDSDAFWSTKVEGSDLSYEEYFSSAVLESCKKYLCALAIFNEEGLTVPESVKAEIAEEIEFYVSLGYVGGGSIDKFNEIIAPYGVDSESLKAAYELEAIYDYVLAYLYGSDASLIASNVKEDYYKANYFRFKQILLPNFYYKYEVDSYGVEIYFDTESAKPLYDTEKGSYLYDEDGNRLKDKYGDPIYFGEDGKPIYDTENGRRSVVLDGNGEGKKYYYTEDEIKARAALAGEINAALEKGDTELFEKKMGEYNVSYGEEEAYPDGYYLSRIEAAQYNEYMVKMLEALEDMEVGETALIESEYGYHVIMKYELDEGKYADGKYAEWFTGFNASLISMLFENKCKDVYAEIRLNTENFEKAKSVKEIGTNSDY